MHSEIARTVWAIGLTAVSLLATPWLGACAAVQVTVTVVDPNDKPIANANVWVYPDPPGPGLSPKNQMGNQYVFEITNATCFSLDVSRRGSMFLSALSGLSARSKQNIVIVLFPMPQSLNAMNADDALRALGSLESRATLPLIVGKDNVPRDFIAGFKDPKIEKALSAVLNNPNKEWTEEKASMIKTKAQKVQDDIQKLPDKIYTEPPKK